MPGLFSRLKTWVANEVLVYSDLNAEFDNIIANLEADTLGGYSATVAQMRSQVNPGGVGSESQASSISGELERIRFAISRIVGKTYWYESPSRSLQSFNIDYRHVFSPVADTTVLEATGEAVDAGILDDVVSPGNPYESTFKGTTGKFSAYSLRNAPGVGAHLYRLDSGRLTANANSYSFWFKNVASGDTLFENPLLGIRVYLNVSGFIQLDFTEWSVSGSDKNVRSITGTTTLAGSASFVNVYFSYSIQNSSSSDAICLYVSGSLIGKISAIALKANKQDSNNSSAFLFASEKNSSVTAQVTQNNNVAPASNGWTVTGTGSETLSDGILSVTTPSGATRYYSNTTGIGSPAGTIPSAGVYFETKIRLTSGFSSINSNPTSRQGHLTFIFRSDTSNLAASIIITGGTIAVGGASGITTTNTIYGDLYEAPWDFSQWTKLTCTFESGLTNVYLNGKYILSGAMETDATAGNLLAFGKFENASPNCTFDMEYFRAGTGQLIPKQNSALTQEISDLVAFRGYQEDPTLIASLQTDSPVSLFGPERNTKVTEANHVNFITRKFIVTGSNAFLIGAVALFSNGRNPTYFSGVASGQSINAATTSMNLYLFAISTLGSTSRPFDALRAPNNNDASSISGPASVSVNVFNNLSTAQFLIPPSPMISAARVFGPGRVVIRFYAKNPSGATPIISQGQFLGFQI